MIELKGKYNKDCKIFIDDIEPEAYSLIHNILDDEVSEGVPVRIMPDTHVGMDIVIGFTMPVTTMLNPSHIGVDIGCGMLSAQLSDTLDDYSLQLLDEQIRRAVPLGINIHKATKAHLDFDVINTNLREFHEKWIERYKTSYPLPEVNDNYITQLCRRVGIEEYIFFRSLGTLGGGNHFIEVGKDTENNAWLTLHSGSRNFGLKVCKYHLRLAKQQMNDTARYAKELDKLKSTVKDKKQLPDLIKQLKKQHGLGVPKKYIQGEAMFNYCIDMVIAQAYAETNRQTMLDLICAETGMTYNNKISAIHNYIDFNDFIIRKGAVAANKGQKLIIPFNMRDGILLCEGKGNADWNCSAPHGAGRILSRGQAKQQLSMDEFTQSMQGIYSTSVCKDTLDESPMAYKDAELIEMLIEPTVKIINRIKPVLNIKSTTE